MKQDLREAQPNDKKGFDIEAALSCAAAFQETGERLLLELPNRVTESDAPHAFPPALGPVVVGAVNLAFAIEVYFKVILNHCRVEQSKRRGHNLGELYRSLPECFRTVIEYRYQQRRAADWAGKYPKLAISAVQRSAWRPEWNNSDVELLELEPLLESSANLFNSWRYVFEVNIPDADEHQIHVLEWALLISACRAIADTIKATRPARPADLV